MAVYIDIETAGIKDLSRLYMSMGGYRKRKITARALNRVGSMARTQHVRYIAKSSGARSTTVRRFMRTKRADAGGSGRQTYEMQFTGGYLSLKEFRPRQTRRGVSASPWGKRQRFKGTFLNRKMGGHVYKREGSARFPIKKLYGPAIPMEAAMADAQQVVNEVARAHLPRRIEHETKQELIRVARRVGSRHVKVY